MIDKRNLELTIGDIEDIKANAAESLVKDYPGILAAVVKHRYLIGMVEDEFCSNQDGITLVTPRKYVYVDCTRYDSMRDPIKYVYRMSELHQKFMSIQNWYLC